MKTFQFSLVLCTRENIEVFITLNEDVYGPHCKRVNVLNELLADFVNAQFCGAKTEESDYCFFFFFISISFDVTKKFKH